MKIKLFDNITVTAEPEEVYMLLKLHHKALQKSEGPKLTITSNGIQYTAGGITQAPTDPFIADQLIAPETPESAAHSMVETHLLSALLLLTGAKLRRSGKQVGL